MTIEGVIIADFIITEVTRPLREPEISVEPTSKMFDLGFVVTLKDKNILNATAYCDGTRFNWQERDGKESQTKTLLVGDIGATFYPFKIELANNQVADEYQIVEFSIKQKITEYGENLQKSFEREIFHDYYKIPRGTFYGLIPKGSTPQIYCNIRLVGEGIERAISRWITVRLRPIFERPSNSDDIDKVFLFCDFRERFST